MIPFGDRFGRGLHRIFQLGGFRMRVGAGLVLPGLCVIVILSCRMIVVLRLCVIVILSRRMIVALRGYADGPCRQRDDAGKHCEP